MAYRDPQIADPLRFPNTGARPGCESGQIFRIVMDLDETVIYCRQGIDVADARKRGLDTFTLGNGTPVLVRPHFYDFLGFVADRFDELYVYTAASPLYAKEVTDVIFHGVPLAQVWTKADCAYTKDSIYKTLQTKTSPAGAPVDSARTVIVDDREEVSKNNVYAHGPNHFVIPRFEGLASDRYLLELMKRMTDWKQGQLRL
jgi:hypothetical protein